MALAIAGLLSGKPTPARALSPEGVFQSVAPSVFVVTAKREGRRVSSGSAVVVGRQLLVTNCHVLKEATEFEVRHGEAAWPATLDAAEYEEDLCLLRAPLIAPAVRMLRSSELKIGARAYSIGAPAGLELTIAEGLVSGRRLIGAREVIQTSAAISRGSSGGGLFDADARLIGITTFFLTNGQNVNFVVPAEAVTRLVARRAEAAHAGLRPKGEPSLPYEPIARALRLGAIDGASGRVPQRPLTSVDDERKFRAWLDSQSDRLKTRLPDPPARASFLKSLDYEAARAGVDRQLALSLVDEMSQFRRYFVGSYSRGYLGVPVAWYALYGEDPKTLFVTQTNLRAGLVLLRSLLDESQGDLFVALNRYADLSLGRSPPQDDAQFPNRILVAWKGRWKYDPDR